MVLITGIIVKRVIVPIYKKGSRESPGNYRPISLTDGLQKVFCRQILFKLEEWIEENSVLTNCQAGFRKKTSTVDQMFRFVRFIGKW